MTPIINSDIRFNPRGILINMLVSLVMNIKTNGENTTISPSKKKRIPP